MGLLVLGYYEDPSDRVSDPAHANTYSLPIWLRSALKNNEVIVKNLTEVYLRVHLDRPAGQMYGYLTINKTVYTMLDRFKVALVAENQKSASSPIGEEKVGGIDLNPGQIDFQIKRDGNGVPLPFDLQPIEIMQIDGFVPVIINVTPIMSVPLLSSLVNSDSHHKTTQEDDYRPTPMAYLDERLFNLN